MPRDNEMLDNWWDEAYSGPVSFMRFKYSQNLEKADIAVLGVPYDLGTTNRPGARFGPRAMREQSTLTGEFPYGLWPWDYHIAEYHTVIDYGDICEFVGYPERMIDVLEKAVDKIIESDTVCFSMGGDHFITLPILRSHVRKHGPVALVHFDAHSDTWVDEDYNHGTMFYHAIKEGLLDIEHSIHVGLRTPNPENHGIEIIFADELDEMKNNGAEVIHLATGLIVGYPPCPFIEDFRRFIETRYGLEVVYGTHPIPEKYLKVHRKIGTWDQAPWDAITESTMADETTRLAYD